MAINLASEMTPGGQSYGIPLADFDQLADNQFAQAWKERYQVMRIQQIPNIARWMRVLRFFHPRRLEDHWQDQFGVPLPKLADSEGLSVAIWNICRPIIETYGSLLAGQKPYPFYLDVKPSDPKIKSERFRADSQEKLLMMEMENMAIPLHFMDFCTSVMMFGIGWVHSWIDHRNNRLQTQTISWPGDVLAEWGSNRYGKTGDALESIITTENIPIDAARRRWPEVDFTPSWPDMAMRPDNYMNVFVPSGQTQILHVWYRHAESYEKQYIGYADIAYAGARDGTIVLYRDDDSQYPDIPFRWASRFQTPGEAPDRAAGVLDDIVGANTEYDERMSAFSDLIMKFVYPKMKGKNYNVNTIPRVDPKQNVIPLGINQDLLLVQDILAGGQGYFDSWIGHAERFMQMSSGLSSLLLGTLPPAETSQAALETLLHASIGRLEVVRTPIQWAWLSMFQDIWVPLLYKFGSYAAKDAYTGKSTKVNLKTLFDTFSGFVWTWPDVTPRDALKVVQTVMEQRTAGLMDDVTAIQRMRSAGSPIDVLEAVRQDYQDPILHPDKGLLAKQLANMMSASSSKAETGPKLTLTGAMTPEQIIAAGQLAGLPASAPAAPEGSPQEEAGESPDDEAAEQAAGAPAPGGKKPPQNPNASAVADALNKAQAAGTATKTTSQNAPPVTQGGPANAAQGVQGTPAASLAAMAGRK